MRRILSNMRGTGRSIGKKGLGYEKDVPSVMSVCWCMWIQCSSLPLSPRRSIHPQVSKPKQARNGLRSRREMGLTCVFVLNLGSLFVCLFGFWFKPSGVVWDPRQDKGVEENN